MFLRLCTHQRLLSCISTHSLRPVTSVACPTFTARVTEGSIRVQSRQKHTLRDNMPAPKIVSSEEVSPSETKWVTLKKLTWSDPDGKQRVWETAERKTRGSSGIDAVAVLPILRSETNAFPPSTVIIEQYRPPVDKFVVELPAGLIDDGETPEQAAIRELEEETGYKSSKVLSSSQTVYADPGMSNANMRLVTIDVPFPGELKIYDQKLDAGEFITRRVVEISKLSEEFAAYEKKGFVVDAKLAYLANGLELAHKLRTGNF